MRITLSAFFFAGACLQVGLYFVGYVLPWLPASACLCLGLAYAFRELEVLTRAITHEIADRLVMRYKLTGKMPNDPE